MQTYRRRFDTAPPINALKYGICSGAYTSTLRQKLRAGLLSIGSTIGYHIININLNLNKTLAYSIL
jgi:hypothetical protein